MAERKVVGVSAAVAVVLLMFSLVAGAATEPPALPPLTPATLTVPPGPVEHARAPGGTRAGGASGSDLAEGDRVVTAPSGRALITFLDGTTVTVEPGSDI